MCADLSNDVDAVFISKNDRLYRPPYAREPNTTAYSNYVPYFICSVSPWANSSYAWLEALSMCYTLGLLKFPHEGGMMTLKQTQGLCFNIDRCLIAITPLGRARTSWLI